MTEPGTAAVSCVVCGKPATDGLSCDECRAASAARLPEVERALHWEAQEVACFERAFGCSREMASLIRSARVLWTSAMVMSRAVEHLELHVKGLCEQLQAHEKALAGARFRIRQETKESGDFDGREVVEGTLERLPPEAPPDTGILVP